MRAGLAPSLTPTSPARPRSPPCTAAGWHCPGAPPPPAPQPGRGRGCPAELAHGGPSLPPARLTGPAGNQRRAAGTDSSAVPDEEGAQRGAGRAAPGGERLGSAVRGSAWPLPARRLGQPGSAGGGGGAANPFPCDWPGQMQTRRLPPRALPGRPPTPRRGTGADGKTREREERQTPRPAPPQQTLLHLSCHKLGEAKAWRAAVPRGSIPRGTKAFREQHTRPST